MSHGIPCLILRYRIYHRMPEENIYFRQPCLNPLDLIDYLMFYGIYVYVVRAVNGLKTLPQCQLLLHDLGMPHKVLGNPLSSVK